MFINKLFAPKWKHKNPQIRKQAILSLDPGDADSHDILFEVINSDAEIALRKLAVKKLRNIDDLVKLRRQSTSTSLTETATLRICELMSGKTGLSLHEGDIITHLDKLNESAIIEYVAKNSQVPSVKKYALEKVKSESVLAEIVLVEADAQLQSDALNRIVNTNALKKLVKDARRKSKELEATVQSRLDGLLELEDRKSTLKNGIKKVATEIRELIALCEVSEEWEKYEEQINKYFEQWTSCKEKLLQCGDSIDSDNESSINEAFQSYSRQLQTITDIKRQQVEQAKSQAETLLAASLNESDAQHVEVNEKATEFCQSVQEKLAKMRDAVVEQQRTPDELKTLVIELQDLDSLDEWHEYTATDLDSCRTDLNVLLESLNDLVRFVEGVSALGKDVEAALKLDAQVKDKQITGFEKRLSKITEPENAPGFDSRYKSRLQEINILLKQLTDKREKAREQQAQCIDEFGKLVNEFEQAVANGKSKHAMNLANRGRKLLADMDKVTKSELNKKGILSQFNRQADTLRDLKDWQHWSTNPVKEKLIDDAKALWVEVEASTQHDYDEIARRVKELREQWREIAKGELAKKDTVALWEQFDQLCNQIYEPCQKYFNQLAERRDLHLQQRNQVCDDLEKYLESISSRDATDINWKGLSKIIRTARDEWKNLGFVNRADKTTVNKRFNKIIHALEKKLKEEKLRNREQKELLINRVTGVYKSVTDQSTTLDVAIESVKKAQEDWKQVWLSDKDKPLWDQFRQHCNEVFELRDAERQAEKMARDEENQQREEICIQVENFSKLTGDEIQKTRREVETIKDQWSQMPRLNKSHGLEKRFNKALAEFAKSVNRQEADRIRSSKEQLQGNLKICFELEIALDSCLRGELVPEKLIESVADAENEWFRSSGKQLSIEKAANLRMQQFKSLVDQLKNEGVEQLAKAIESKEKSLINDKEFICLKMEILANVESPPDKKQARMAYQIEQLADKMKQTEQTDKHAEADELLVLWHSSGYIPPKLAQSLEQRFYYALKEIDKVYQYLS